MEIQFSIPVGTGRGRAQAANSGDTSSQPAATAETRGGTHRFALDSRTKHTRRSSTRARTGCSTCKKRHVKCDETKPSCLNCMKWRGYCDGYTDGGLSDRDRVASNSRLIHTKKAPLLLEEPLVNLNRFENADQHAYFDAWTSLSVTFLSGGLRQTRLWTATMPQVTLEEKTLRYGAMAIGALRKALETNDTVAVLTTRNKHYLNAIIYYCEALRLQSKAEPTREGLRTAMMSSLLFICFETQRGNMPAALKHITHGFSMLNELAACTEKAPDLVSIAPAPPSLVEEILDCYRPLELQSRSFMGSYRKFFFPSQKTPNQETSASGGPLGTSRPPVSTGSSSPSSQPGTPWQGQSAERFPATGLPSPQSHGSPNSTKMQSPSQATTISSTGSSPRNMVPPTTPGGSIQTGYVPPGKIPPGAPPGAPPRPAGIMPFTKHSPYFRPKQSNITTLEGMPRVFKTLDEVNGYWALVQRQMVQYIPMLTMMTSQLALPRATDDADVEAKLASILQNPKMNKFIAESRYWLQRWIEAFDPMFHAASRNGHKDRQMYLTVASLRIEYLILYIYTTVPRYSGLITAKGLTPQYREINLLAETLLAARPNCGFAMDSGWTWPLFVVSFGCRDPAVRAEALRILGQYPIRNALRDSRVFRAIALKNQDAEAICTSRGNENDHWLQLRRRELVFEDFGTHIIFRSPVWDPDSRRWELIEEVADFVVQPDGRLTWHRQPISDSTSILSGVC